MGKKWCEMKKMYLEGLIPYPREAEARKGSFILHPSCKVSISAQAKKDYSYWLGKLGLDNIETVAFPSEIYVICIGERSVSNITLSKFEQAESYTLDISTAGILLTAKEEAGLSLGLRTLVKMRALADELKAVFIDDAPMVRMRAIHMCLFNPNDGSEKDDTSPEVVKKRIELAALLGYNYVFIEFWGMFPYKRHPYACWPDSYYTAEKIEEIVNWCINDLHITPCPAQNLTSHAGWSRITTRQHVVLDQCPELADMWIPGGWCFATENPKTKQFLRDVIDELIEAFHKPPMLHMCCDKAFGFGSTEEDRTKSADILFAQHISNLNSYICSQGVRPVMWGDMLYSSMDSLIFKCKQETANMLPKNILINIWTHNDPGEYWYDIDFFESKGFQTVYSPFMNYDSIRNMIKLCLNKKSLGIVQTTWHKPEQAKPYFTYSAGKQWNFAAEYSCADIENFIKKLE